MNFRINEPVYILSEKKKGIVKEIVDNQLKVTFFSKDNDERKTEFFTPEELRKHQGTRKQKRDFIVKVKKVSPDAIIPMYQSKGAAGFDIATIEDMHVPVNGTAIADTGLAFEIPEGYELEIRGRSGNAFKYRIFSFNGTIDADFRGQVKLLLINHGTAPITFNKGERVAQGVIKRIQQANFIEVDELSNTERGTNGFGSTGK